MPMSSSRVTVLGASFVQGREHQMSGQRGADRDLRRLQVAHLADEDHVGILPQERPQGRGEVTPMSSRTRTWLIPAMLNSTGSSAVMMLMSGLLMVAIAA